MTEGKAIGEERWHDGRFDRLFVAAVTPFKEDRYDVDEDGLRSFLRYSFQLKYVKPGPLTP